MAMPVPSFEDFVSKYRELSNRSRLFAFLLCDNRPSHQGVQRFARENFQWLDELAGAAHIFFFIFRRTKDARKPSSNPSLKVAELFRIRPNQLPGIVLFTLIGKKGATVNRAVYLPLDTSLFSAESSLADEIFADLFAGIQKCLETTETEEQLWLALESAVEGVRSKGKRRSFIRHLQSLATLPMKFLESMVAALGEGAAKGITGG